MPALPKEEEALFSQLDDIIEQMGDEGVSDLLAMSNKDFSEVASVLLEEARNIVDLHKYRESAPLLSDSGLASVREGYETYLRKSSLLYFVSSLLPDFELAWHCMEWMSMIQMYNRLCVICARDHCFGKDTPILLYNGSVRAVQDIKVGDFVMGPDSMPRKVLSLHSGVGKLYKVEQSKGDSYIVNENHIMSLIREGKNGKHAIYDVPIKDCIGKGRVSRCLGKGYKVCIDYSDYYEGDDLSDSYKKGSITGKKLCEKDCPRINVSYIFTSNENRREFFAGVLDSGGVLCKGMWAVLAGSLLLARDVKKLADSLGYKAEISEKRWLRKWVVYISGVIDELPLRFKESSGEEKEHISLEGYDITLLSSLKIRKWGSGEYYGFEVDGDHRFCLADSTVVHNSKSFTFSFAHVLWRLYRYQKPTEDYEPPFDIKYYKEGMLITNEFKLAKRLLKKVRDEIKSNPVLRKALQEGDSDSSLANESLHCANGAEITISSFRTSNRGPHPGWIIVDDFLDKSAIYSNAQREKFKEVFNAEIMNMILPQGSVYVIGTPFHEKDLYSDLKKDPSWNVFEYPALFPDGSVLWDNRYDFEALKQKRESLGSLIFSREILVRPISDSATIFPYSILERAYIGTENVCMAPNRASFPVRMRKVVIGADWALSSNVGADFSWFTVLGEDDFGQMWLMWVEILHGERYNQQIEKLRALNVAFAPDVIVAETNVFQKVMADLAKDAGITNIVEEVTGNRKKDIYEGLPALAVYFEQYKYKFPRGDENSREKTNLLCSQLNSMAFDDDKGTLEGVGEHDDGCMSLYFATKGIKSVNGVFRVSTT